MGSCCCKQDIPSINVKTDMKDSFKFKCNSTCCNPVSKNKHKKRNSKDRGDLHNIKLEITTN